MYEFLILNLFYESQIPPLFIASKKEFELLSFLNDSLSFFILSWVLISVFEIDLNLSFEKIDFALARAKAAMMIFTINYFIAISSIKLIFHNLPFGIAHIFRKKDLRFKII